ncbi:cytochrome C oxidase subunit IV family protein [Pseudoxanthomonas sp. JBR18]|uniref:cytochrome o ubiquinol oxidase subunit IV n=1 Tax=Pseudoxanthomonas sp. JBR18 TaxID=2969308 RepID=UPI0023067DA6|nr:cytochrome C oxidase subunit IV family protein [Pseudoxanthomonas sp. JBR18]WCE02553.1 cytochrome C oxidase subunit IV family protein [Pseudoxanthomonas sp. JBR18]
MEDRQAFGRELRRYVVGLVLALVLSGAAFALVAWHPLPPDGLLGVIAGLALLQVVAHFRFFLHIDLKQSHRDDLQLILFTGLIIGLMVAGSLWIIFNQNQRMM